MASAPSSVVFFDGHCALCNGTVAKLIKIDHGRRLFEQDLFETIRRAPSGTIVSARVWDPAPTGGLHAVLVGLRDTPQRWSCGCTLRLRDELGICAHMVAVRLLGIANGIRREQIARQRRLEAWPEIQRRYELARRWLAFSVSAGAVPRIRRQDRVDEGRRRPGPLRQRAGRTPGAMTSPITAPSPGERRGPCAGRRRRRAAGIASRP